MLPLELISNVLDGVAILLVIQKVYKSKVTFGLSFYWSLFGACSATFSILGNITNYLAIITGLIKVIPIGYLMYRQFTLQPRSNKFKEQIYMTYYFGFSIVMFLLSIFGFMTLHELSFWFEAFAVASQSHITKSSSKISNLGWPFIVIYALSQIMRSIAGIFYSFQTEQVSMWFDFVSSVSIFLFMCDLFFFFTSSFFKFNEGSLPL